MHVISKKKIREFWAVHAKAESPLNSWFRLAKTIEWSNFAEVKAAFPGADQVGKYTVFDIGGNNYRVIAEINYTRGKVFVRYVLTHADYSRGRWKGV